MTELSAYFTDPRHELNLPTAVKGTVFQHKVWRAIHAIPSGETRSYGELARDLSTSPRAIGGACRANPIPLLIPCHRVIAADGGTGGFLGHTANHDTSASVKDWLLQHERN
jgi:methylated-DNA-[protein]-cysteine S-methyltransferase